MHCDGLHLHCRCLQPRLGLEQSSSLSTPPVVPLLRLSSAGSYRRNETVSECQFYSSLNLRGLNSAVGVEYLRFLKLRMSLFGLPSFSCRAVGRVDYKLVSRVKQKRISTFEKREQLTKEDMYRRHLSTTDQRSQDGTGGCKVILGHPLQLGNPPYKLNSQDYHLRLQCPLT